MMPMMDDGETLAWLRFGRTPGLDVASLSRALELFETARVLGGSWAEVVVVGVEPRNVRTGIGLSAVVESALGAAAARAQAILREMVETYVFSHTR